MVEWEREERKKGQGGLGHGEREREVNWFGCSSDAM